MPKTKVQKQEIANELKSKLDQQNALVFVDYKGLAVKDMNALRRQLRLAGGVLQVAKKTILEKVFQEKGVDIDPRKMEGQIGLVFALGDPLAAIKETDAFGTKNENLKILGGYMDAQPLTTNEVKQLALLPSKDQLRAQFVGMLAAPISGFATVLQGNLKGLLYALNSIQEKKA